MPPMSFTKVNASEGRSAGRAWLWLLAGLVLAGPAQARRWAVEKGEWVETAAPEPGTPEGDLYAAQRAFADGQVKQAQAAVRAWIEKYPDSPEMPAALFLLAEVERAQGNYHKAFEQYEAVLDQYPGTREWSLALGREYRIAEEYLEGRRRKFLGLPIIDATPDAVEILLRIHERNPESELAQRALLRLADYYFYTHAWLDAEATYQVLLEGYPRGRHRRYALRRSAESAMNRYYGPAFDDTPLLDARARFEAYRDAAGEPAERAKVAAILDDIEAKRAEKALAVARFYRRTGRKAGALRYYREVIEHWPDAPASLPAREGLQEMEK